MGLLNVFPTPIYTHFVPQNIADKMEEIITPRLKDLELDLEVLTDFFHDTKIVSKEEISPFIDYLKTIADIYSKESNIKQNTLGNFWIQDYKANNSHGPHAHPNCSISGTYYIRANEYAGELSFFNPNPYDRITVFNNPIEQVFNIKPQKGLLVLFPSWLLHEVIPSNHPGCIRTSFSFNLLI